MVSSNGSQEPVCVLVVESDPVARRLLAEALRADACRVHQAADTADAMDFSGERIDGAIVCVDAGAPHEIVSVLRHIGIAGPIVAMSRNGSVQHAVETMRAGADDFLVKPFQAANVARRLLAKIGEPQGSTVRASSVRRNSLEDFHDFIGSSPAMLSLYAQIERVAPSKAPVFITGESGAGKEVCAEAVHACSGRAGGPFIAINCSAIPRELMESEIFGHVKGAFTGAHEDRAGAAELAHGGTLFLDEVGELDLALQAKLLRFVQTGTVRRVGDTKLKHVDVRFVCATNREPAREIQAGRFREDLYYRLHVLPLHLPPLRERGEDIVRLARAFLLIFTEEEGRRFRGFAPEAEYFLRAHRWPGNVRELQNVIRRVVVLHDGEEVSADMLALSGTHEPARDTGALPVVPSPSIDPFWQQEQRIIKAALEAFDGNAHKAAHALEISPSTIYRKLQAWGQGRAAG